MRKLYVVLLVLTSVFSNAQDKLAVFKSAELKTEILSSSIDSITFPNQTTMRIHYWNATIKDIPIAEIDSIKVIPDSGSAKTDREALIAFYNSTNVLTGPIAQLVH